MGCSLEVLSRRSSATRRAARNTWLSSVSPTPTCHTTSPCSDVLVLRQVCASTAGVGIAGVVTPTRQGEMDLCRFWTLHSGYAVQSDLPGACNTGRCFRRCTSQSPQTLCPVAIAYLSCPSCQYTVQGRGSPPAPRCPLLGSPLRSPGPPGHHGGIPQGMGVGRGC